MMPNAAGHASGGRCWRGCGICPDEVWTNVPSEHKALGLHELPNCRAGAALLNVRHMNLGRAEINGFQDHQLCAFNIQEEYVHLWGILEEAGQGFSWYLNDRLRLAPLFKLLLRKFLPANSANAAHVRIGTHGEVDTTAHSGDRHWSMHFSTGAVLLQLDRALWVGFEQDRVPAQAF